MYLFLAKMFWKNQSSATKHIHFVKDVSKLILSGTTTEAVQMTETCSLAVHDRLQSIEFPAGSTVS